VDYPGGNYEIVIDKLANAEGEKTVILVVSPTKSYEKRNEIDNAYITDQFNTIQKLWTAVLRSTTLVKPKTFILFINKMDLYDDTTIAKKAFSNHISALQDACKKRSIKFETPIYGSVVKRTGLQSIIEILKKRK
jgi:GTPase SAR1 family protein